MAKTNTRKYLIYGSIAAIVGVVVYYIWKGSKKDDKPKDDTPAPDNDGNQKDGNIKDNGGGATPPVKDCTNNSTLKSENAIRKFQYYVINTKGDKTILLPDNDDGIWGCKTRAAWDKYGADYKKSLGGGTPEEGSAVAGITTQNRDNFNKLVASYPKGTLSQTPSGIRIWTLKFHEIIRGQTYDIWKIDLYEQTSLKDKQTQYAIKDEDNKTIQVGYYTNAGKNMRATGGLHAPFTAPPQANLAKSISAVLKMGAIQKWL